HVLRHIGDTEASDVGGMKSSDVVMTEDDGPFARPPQPHNGPERGRLAGAVAPEKHVNTALRHLQRDAVQDMILPDIGVDIIEPQDGTAHATSSSPTPR